jgi:histidinol-phosphate phosphatase family protein
MVFSTCNRPGPARRAAVFFDRDGTVNESPGPGYLLRWEDFRFRVGVREALAAVKRRGFLTILVTNQQGVGKGLMQPADLEVIHARMQAELGPLAFDDIYVCPHLEGTCDCRKPAPGMLLAAAARHDLDLACCWNIGDKEHDLEMGRRAGVAHNLLIGGPELPDWSAFLTLWEHQFQAASSGETKPPSSSALK